MISLKFPPGSHVDLRNIVCFAQVARGPLVAMGDIELPKWLDPSKLPAATEEDLCGLQAGLRKESKKEGRAKVQF